MRRLTAIIATLVLVLVAAPSAQAVWNADASISATASTAAVGVVQTGDLAGLGHTYTPTAPPLVAAAALTVQNTGTRPAAVTVTVAASGATVPGLPAAVQVSAGTVGSAAACTTTATLTSPQTGTLGGTFVYAPSALQLAAGASTVVCLRTSLSVADATTFGATSLQVTAQSKLTYAAGAAWTATGTPVTATQSVASTLLFFTDSAGRYLVSLRDAAGTPVCVYRRISGGTTYPVRASDCIGSTSQWRLSSAGTNLWYISEAVNSAPQSTEKRWHAAGTAVMTMAAPQESDAQRWQIIGRGGGTFSAVNAATGACAAMSASTLWPDGPAYLTTAACDTSDQRQAFSFTAIGTPVPSQPHALVCSGNPYFMEQLWPQNTGYEAEATYQVFLNGVLVATQTNGYNPRWQVGNTDAALEAFVAAHGAGLLQVEVRQSVSGSAWLTYAVGAVTVTRFGTRDNRLACS